MREARAFADAWNHNVNDARLAEIVMKARDRLLKSVMVLEAAKELAEDLAKAKPASDGGRMNEAAIGKSRVKS